VRSHQDDMCGLYKQSAQIFTAAFRDQTQDRFAAG
jgi:hypothetical protein